MALGSFTIALDSFQIKTERQLVNVCQKIAMEAFKGVILKSPVDTGRFRANWGCSVGTPYAGYDVNAFDKSGSGSMAKAMQVVNGWKARINISLVNNLPYSLPLEYGHSKQAPSGMVRLTLTEMGGIATGGQI
ncbi:MAG: hypothetical protein WCP20_10985 [Desulfuromonadales bacterium]